jgi:hypothetical protein
MATRTSLSEYGRAAVALLAVMSGMTACQTVARTPTPSDDGATSSQKDPPSSVEQGRTPLDESFDEPHANKK